MGLNTPQNAPLNAKKCRHLKGQPTASASAVVVQTFLRCFRLDRIQSITLQPESFKLDVGQRLIDYFHIQDVNSQELSEGQKMSKEYTMKIVECSELTVYGLAVRTSNVDEMLPASARIGNLWNVFGIKIAPKMASDAHTYGVYHHYESDASGNFDVLVGTDAVLSAGADSLGWKSVNIAAGLYLVFEVKGAVPQAVVDAWVFIWQFFDDPQCPYKREYKTDFERYRSKGFVEIFISISRC